MWPMKSAISNWWEELQEEEYQETFRMSRNTLIDLQAEIDYCEKLNIDRVDKMLLACVWLLGNTQPLKEAEEIFSIDDIESVMSTYLLKIAKLSSLYILWPTPDECKLIESSFVAKYQFPGIVGVIGSLHIEINGKDLSDSNLYYNKIMQKNTIVLQVVCDNNLILRDVCVGCPGGNSIKDILENSPLYSQLKQEDNSLVKYNQHLLGGTEHPPLNNLLTPYKFMPGTRLTQRQGKFNLLHSTAMCAVERTFRCLENRFPRLTSVDNLKPKLASLIASSVCVLHNFTTVRNDSCEKYM